MPKNEAFVQSMGLSTFSGLFIGGAIAAGTADMINKLNPGNPIATAVLTGEVTTATTSSSYNGPTICEDIPLNLSIGFKVTGAIACLAMLTLMNLAIRSHLSSKAERNTHLFGSLISLSLLLPVGLALFEKFIIPKDGNCEELLRARATENLLVYSLSMFMASVTPPLVFKLAQFLNNKRIQKKANTERTYLLATAEEASKDGQIQQPPGIAPPPV